MNTSNISVPRENVNNTGVCKAVEEMVLTLIVSDPENAFHVKDIARKVNRKLGRIYGELGYHVTRAVDQFFANRLIKRVAPSTFQSVDGPDEEYSERLSGHVPEGEPYATRPANYTNNPTVPSARRQALFNQELRKVEASVGILQQSKMTLEQIKTTLLNSGNFNPVAVKFCCRQPEPDTTEVVKA